MSTCVVTGGAGFLGSHLCDHLLAKGHRVICVDNLDTGSLQNIEHIRDPKFTFLNHDLTEPLVVEDEVDFVYHLASPASPIDYARLPLHTLKVGSYGTHHMLGLAKFKRARFLLASTSEVYGDPQVHPQPEDYWGHVNPIGPRGVYDEAKRYAEALTMAYHRQQGVDTCIVRIFNTYGARMRPHDGRAIPTFLRQALQDKPLTVFGDGSQTRSFCYVDDLIRGLRAARRVRRPPAGQPRQPERDDPAASSPRRVIEVTESRSEIVFEALPVDDPQVRQPDITRARQLLGWEPRSSSARAAAHDRAGGRRAARRRHRLSAGPASPTGRLRIAHLTATFPPYPGGAGNTCYRFATGQAERGHHVEVFTAPADGRAARTRAAPSSTGSSPLLAIGNAPLIPSLARIEGFDVVHLHYPFIFGSELTLLGRLRANAPAPGAARPLQEPAGRQGRPRGAVRGLRAHGRAAPGPRRGPGLRALARPRALGPLPAPDRRAPPGEADRDAERRRHRAVRARAGRSRAARLGSGSRTTRWSRPSSPPSTAPTTSSGSTSRSTALARTLGDERASHLVVAGGGELLDGFRDQAAAAGVGERVHFLGPVPHAELPGVLRAADLFLLTTEPPESFGIVLIEAMACGLPAIATDYPGVRAVVDDGRDRAPGPRRRRRRRRGRARRADRRRAPTVARRMGAAGREKAERLWSWPRLLDRMDEAYAEAIDEPPARSRMNLLLVAYFYPAVPRHRRPPARRRWRSGCAGSAIG